MEIFHHYGITLSSDRDRKAFRDVGIELESGARLPWSGGRTIVGLDIGEMDKRWGSARPVIERYKITEFLSTKFTDSELNSASEFCMLGGSQRGYPQPEEDFGFLSATYNLADYCSNCGNGCRQVKPFRLKSIPVLKRSVMQLNWIFDEFFVSHEIWAEVFKAFGIDCWPVIAHKSGEKVESLVQLKIEEKVRLRIEDGNRTDCVVCGRSKMPFDLKGFAPAPVVMSTHICRSIQAFGSGAAGFNRIMVSASLYRTIKKSKLRGIQFYPCALQA